MDAAANSADLAPDMAQLAPLLIEANFLSPLVMAASKTGRNEPEWPLHPSRLFSALVAALHGIPEQDLVFREAEAALVWLETLGPPEVHAPPVDGLVRPLHYVPFNDVSILKKASQPPLEASLPDSPRRKKARVSPGVSVQVPLIRYVWWVDPQEVAHWRSGLQLVLSRVPSLGRSVNLVIMRLLEVAPESLPNADALDRWLPSVHGSQSMRTFGPGRLAHLRQLYQDGKPVDHGPASLYLRAGDEPPLEAVSGPWSQMWTTFSLAGCQATAADTEAVAKAIRRTLVHRAIALGLALDGHVDPFLSGHEPDGAPTRIDRLAVVPLANIMHPHADARIMGFAIVMPTCATAEQWGLLSAVFFGPDGATPLGQILMGRREVRVAQVDRPKVLGLSAKRYVAGANVWTTATPILLSRRVDHGRDPVPPERLAERVRAQVANDCVTSGLPTPIQIEVGPVSPLDGVGHARSFRQQRSGHPRWSTHATLFFDRVVHGPLLVGAGRYNGLGLLVPVPDDAAGEEAKS